MNNNDDDNKRIDEIISELSDCREDERSAENQMLQVIATAGTILSVIYAGSDFIPKGNELGMFIVSVIVFCTAFAYIITIGIKNVLRYHYIQDMEDRLAALIPKQADEKEFVHWMSFSSPILTRNPQNLTSFYSKMHYMYYFVAVALAISFCMSVVYFQFRNLNEDSFMGNLLLRLLIISMLISVVVFVLFSLNAKKMYNFSLMVSIEKKRKRIFQDAFPAEKRFLKHKSLSKKRKDFQSVALYFFYPKWKDLQKSFLVILGFLTGVFLANGYLTLQCEQITNLFITVIVIDVLAYQARYQWNDIRGLKEDMISNKEGRLPVRILGEKRAVSISLVIMAGKIILAIIIAALWNKSMTMPLLICIALIIVFSIFYEYSRTMKIKTGIFFIVSLGYPLRLLAGMWAAYPELWTSSIPFIGSSVQTRTIITLLLGAYGFFGEMSVALPWTYEAIDEGQEETGKFNTDNIKKSHYKLLFNRVEKRTKKSVNKMTDGKFYPLREKGKIFDLWNISFIASVSMLSAIIFLMPFSSVYYISEVVLIICSTLICFAAYKNIIFFSIIALGIVVVKSIVLSSVFGCFPFHIYIGCNQILMIATYLVLRYSFDSDFNFMKSCKRFFVRLIVIIIGKETWDYISGEKKAN